MYCLRDVPLLLCHLRPFEVWRVSCLVHAFSCHTSIIFDEADLGRVGILFILVPPDARVTIHHICCLKVQPLLLSSDIVCTVLNSSRARVSFTKPRGYLQLNSMGSVQ